MRQVEGYYDEGEVVVIPIGLKGVKLVERLRLGAPAHVCLATVLHLLEVSRLAYSPQLRDPASASLGG